MIQFIIAQRKIAALTELSFEYELTFYLSFLSLRQDISRLINCELFIHSNLFTTKTLNHHLYELDISPDFKYLFSFLLLKFFIA